MPHFDPEALALMALGEPCDDAAQVDHLDSCVDCQRELASLAEVVATARVGVVDVPGPGPDVWGRIAAAAFVPGSATTDDASSVVELRPARDTHRWWPLVAVAAALALVVGGAGVLGLLPWPSSSAVTVASTELVPLPGTTSTATGGRAVLLQDGAGYHVEVDAVGLGSSAGFYEVWLMSPDDSGLISLGTMSSGQSHAEFSVPAGLPLSMFSAVDISDEPVDGNPQHSATTVLRGQFSL